MDCSKQRFLTLTKTYYFKNMQRLFFVSLFICLQLFSYSQDNYSIKSNMKIEGLPDDMAGFADMEILTCVKGEKSKIETTGMMMSKSTYFDGKNLTLILNLMGDKIACVVDKQKLNEIKKGSTKSKKPSIKYTNEKKKILNYDCTKVLITVEEESEASNKITLTVEPKKETTHTAWITDKLKPLSANLTNDEENGMDLSELKGVILEMETSVKENGMDLKMKMTTTEISTKTIDDAQFKANTEGCRMVDYNEMLEIPKKMGR